MWEGAGKAAGIERGRAALAGRSPTQSSQWSGPARTPERPAPRPPTRRQPPVADDADARRQPSSETSCHSARDSVRPHTLTSAATLHVHPPTDECTNCSRTFLNRTA